MYMPAGVPQVGRQNLCLSVGIRLYRRAFCANFIIATTNILLNKRFRRVRGITNTRRNSKDCSEPPEPPKFGGFFIKHQETRTMKKIALMCALSLYAFNAYGECSTSTTPASCKVNTTSCSGGYCTTTYSYVEASTTCTCNDCCTAAEAVKCKCPLFANGVSCSNY